MSLLRACYDWRVLTGLAALGIGIFVLAPGIAAAALPLLILAACPLSMLLMMKSMGGQNAPVAGAESPATGDDRVAAMRSELVELGRRHEELAGQLAAIEASEAEVGADRAVAGADAEPAR